LFLIDIFMHKLYKKILYCTHFLHFHLDFDDFLSLSSSSDLFYSFSFYKSTCKLYVVSDK